MSGSEKTLTVLRAIAWAGDAPLIGIYLTADMWVIGEEGEKPMTQRNDEPLCETERPLWRRFFIR